MGCHVSLRAKVLTSQILLATVPMCLVAGLSLWLAGRSLGDASRHSESALDENNQSSRQALIEAGTTDLVHVAQTVLAMCQVQQELLEQKLRGDLNVARDVLRRAGGATLAAETATWKAVNQETGQTQEVVLPKMLVAQKWLGQNADPRVASPIVDEVKSLVGGTCTIFQRMNEAGDMLRVCTNVVGSDGSRAIGTYIPVAAADGGRNPVLAAVLDGKTYVWRAFVVNAWYVTAYEPIRDAAGKVVGMLYVGVKEESAESLRRAIMSIRIARTGYVYVLNAKGKTRGHYVISKDGKRDGENIWEAKDSDGNLFIQDICRKAVALAPGQTAEHRYPWKNAEDEKPVPKTVRIAYFAPWDWVIGVGAPESELFESVHQMQARAEQATRAIAGLRTRTIRSMVVWCLVAVLAAAAVSGAVSMLVTRGIVRPLRYAIGGLNEGSRQVAEAASQVSAAAQRLAEGASEQSSALDTASQSIKTSAEMSRKNAHSAGEADRLMHQVRDNMARARQVMNDASQAMSGIAESSQRIGKIIRVVEEIAFQTNLLALNAAVEAARAGEHGKGFAVVAEEVRTLARRSADAAKEIAALIEETGQRISRGVELNRTTIDSFGEVDASAQKIGAIVSEIAQASSEQANGVERITEAMSEVEQVTQQNAAVAEESASAAEQLSAQAVTVKDLVDQLVRLTEGGRRRGEGRAEDAAERASAAV